MRGTFLTLASLGLLCMLPTLARASDEEQATAMREPANVMFADLSLGVLGVAYERVLLDDFSLQIAVQFYRPWYVSERVLGYGGQLRASFFLYGHAPEGLYLSPGARLYFATLDTADAPRGWAASWSATIGYSFMAWDALVLRLGVGPQVHFAKLARTEPDVDFAGAFPIVDIFAGYAF